MAVFLMDSWYATTQMMTRLQQMGKVFYCPIKPNRLVDETKAKEPYCPIETLIWSEFDDQQGKVVKVKVSAKNFYMKLYRVIFPGRKSCLSFCSKVLADCST